MKTKIATPENTKYTKYLDYIKKTGGNPEVGWFDVDWEPIGPTVRREMESAGLIKIVDGRIELAAKGP